jgi:hypothetical protein
MLDDHQQRFVTKLSDAVEHLEEFLLQALDASARNHCVIYADECLRHGGVEPVEAAAPRWPLPHWLAFVDLQPQANWMHPCCWLIVDQANLSVSVIPGDQPPVFGTLAPSWRVIWCSGDVAEWQLLPLSTADPPSHL